MSGNHNFSFEFFPPKTAEGAAKLVDVTKQLGQLNPAFFSVTFGAGGSTQEGTLSTVQTIRALGFAAAPHLSCIGSTVESIRQVLQQYRDAGIKHIVALRGDLPSGMAQAGAFRHASDLVAFIRAEHGNHFHLEVAAYPEYHPQARHAMDDLKNFKNKVDAGADSAITQYFFNADAYFHFVDEVRAMGVALPIVPGIMPIANFSQLARFPMRAAPRFRAGFAARWKVTAMTAPRSRRLVWMWSRICVPRCSKAAHRASTFTP